MGALLTLTETVTGVSRTALELRLRGFAPTCGGYLQAPPLAGGLDDGLAARLARSYARTAVLPWSSCLTRSIALCRSLRRRDMPAVLRIGANLDSAGFRAHAWVELGGRVVNDRDTVTEEFSPLQ